MAFDNLQKTGLVAIDDKNDCGTRRVKVAEGAATHLAENGVFAIEMRRRHCGDEELAAVGVWASIRHGEQVLDIVRQRKTTGFVSKLFSINALTTGAVVPGKVATLAHEVWNDSMKTRALVRQRYGWVTLAQTGCTST
jgi:hypothetical protein